MAFFRTCDGVGRRDFLRAGVVGGTGLTLASYAQLASANHVNPNAKAKLYNLKTDIGEATDVAADNTDVVEKLCIETAIKLTNNNRASAAEMLGLSRQSLYVKLRKYGLIAQDD